MLLAIALPFFWSCSDDEEATNTEQCTVGFASEEVQISEATTGYTNIPINVSGYRNGSVQVKVEAAPVEKNGAVEGTHYLITDKTLNIKADTLSTGTINVEVKVIDDNEINEDRQFTLTIVSANGAKISTQKTTVTIKDNDGDTYLAFAGTWTLKAKRPVYDEEGYPTGEYTDFSADVTLSCAADESSADYEKIIKASCPAMFDVGVSLDCSWRFRYNYNKETRQGTLGFICGEEISSLDNGGQLYQWAWATDDGRQITYDDVTGSWSVEEGKVLPDVITFPTNQMLYLYQTLYQPSIGLWDAVYDITLTKKQ